MVDISSSESVDEHLERILSRVEVLATRSSGLDSSIGLVLAEDVTALTDVPGFDNSAMDGYAVRQADLIDATGANPTILPVIADLAAGSAEDVRLIPGTVALIMTGAPLPDGADAVVPFELTDRGTEHAALFQTPVLGAHIRRAGGDVRVGDPVLTVGQLLTARHISAAAAVGRNELLVHPAPRVGVISTGSELAPPGQPLGRGQIHDSNSYLLAAAVTEAGGTPLRIGSVPDDEGQLRDLLTEYAAHVDAFILSGGVSAGTYDVVKALLSPLGTRFGPVRMQPGKPQGFGLWEGSIPLFCLPGNPVSAFVSFEAFVRPALMKLRGRSDLLRRKTIATAVEGWRSPASRQQYMPVTVQQAEGTEAADNASRTFIRPATAGGSGSHLVAGLAAADALAIIPEDVSQVQEGDQVTIMLLSDSAQ